MTEGDKGLIKELIGIFSTQVKEYGLQMNRYFREQKWEELSKLAHKAKSTVGIMGMKELYIVVSMYDIIISYILIRCNGNLENLSSFLRVATYIIRF